MSYDVAFVRGDIPADDQAALEWLAAQVENEDPCSEIPDFWQPLYAQIAERYPSNFEEGLEDDEESVWSSSLQDSFFDRFAYLNIGYPFGKELVPYLCAIAEEFSIHFVNASANAVHRANGIPGLSLTTEQKGEHRKPTAGQIEAAAQGLNPAAGNGFMILEGPGDDYMQAAGGGTSCTAEWREYSGSAFRHFVAGRQGTPSQKTIKIATNGASVTVLEHERLDSTNVATIALAFANKAGRPAQYVWRDVSERFS